VCNHDSTQEAVPSSCQLFLRSFANQVSRLSRSSRSSLSKKDVDAPAVKMFETQLKHPNVYRLMTAMALLQLPMWIYLSYFSYFELDPKQLKKQIRENQQRRASDNSKSIATKAKTTDLDSWKLSSKARLFLSVLSLSAGLSFCSMTLFFQWKLVKSVTFVRATKSLQIVTGTPFGTLRTLQVPLSSVTCPAPPRKNAGSSQYIMLVVKGHRLKFLLDPQNAEINPWFQTLVLSRR